MTEEAAAHYLAAMIDGEGTIQYRHKGGKRKSATRHIRIANTDMDLINAAARCCTVLGIEFTIISHGKKIDERHKKECFGLCIHRRGSFEKVHELVPIQSRDKRSRLQTIIESYVFVKRPSERELRRMYSLQRMTAADIGKAYGVRKETAYVWLVHYGINRPVTADA